MSERLTKARDEFYAALQEKVRSGSDFHCAALVVMGPEEPYIDWRVIGKGRDDVKQSLEKILNDYSK